VAPLPPLVTGSDRWHAAMLLGRRGHVRTRVWLVLIRPAFVPGATCGTCSAHSSAVRPDDFDASSRLAGRRCWRRSRRRGRHGYRSRSGRGRRVRDRRVRGRGGRLGVTGVLSADGCCVCNGLRSEWRGVVSVTLNVPGCLRRRLQTADERCHREDHSPFSPRTTKMPNCAR
jgi:hypothetical protein